MSSGHVHIGRAPRASDTTVMVLSTLVGLIAMFTAIGAVLTWPTNFAMLGSVPSAYEGASWEDATITKGVDEQGLAYATIDGDDSGREYVLAFASTPTLAYDPQPGDRIRVLKLENDDLVFTDFIRDSTLLTLLITYIVVVIAVAWWRGLGALLGLTMAFGIVLFYTVPALLDGSHPLTVGLVTGTGALFALLYLAHGVNSRTSTAYLGTLAGLLVTTALGAWAVTSSKLSGLWDEQAEHLAYIAPHVSLPGVILCGVILAGLGVLNDVTVTQASAVWELRGARPDASRWELFVRGMRIGRDHIASTVYTISFAYVGAALPTVIVVSLYDRGALETLTSYEIAEEIVRTLVGSIGLVLAVPLTTAIGALVVGENAIADPAEGPSTGGDSPPSDDAAAEAGAADDAKAKPKPKAKPKAKASSSAASGAARASE